MGARFYQLSFPQSILDCIEDARAIGSQTELIPGGANVFYGFRGQPVLDEQIEELEHIMCRPKGPIGRDMFIADGNEAPPAPRPRESQRPRAKICKCIDCGNRSVTLKLNVERNIYEGNRLCKSCGYAHKRKYWPALGG